MRSCQLTRPIHATSHPTLWPLPETTVDFVMEIKSHSRPKCQNNYDLIRTFLVTDECGNMAEATQVVSVRDFEGPTILSDLKQQLGVRCALATRQS